jgi:trimeric autotransporter adhesin
MPFDYTGSFSGSFYGDIASTNGVLSSSAQVISSLPDGVVSASTQINYIDLQNKPVTISAFQKNSIVANTNFRQSTFPPISESFDSRITILTSDVSTLSGQIQAAVSGTVPPGTISGSVQITEFGYLTSASAAAAGFGSGGGSSTDISALNTFTASIQSEVNTLTAVTSSYLTSVPSGTISGSSQITITESQISDLGSYLVSVPVGTISSSAQIAGLGYLTSETDSQTLTYVGDTLTISNGNSVTIPTGSNLPAGVISGSSQITITESQISDLGSYLTSVPAGTVSGSSQITSVITDTYISASAALSGFGAGGGSSTDISALNTFTASIQTEVTTLTAATSSYLTSADTGSFILVSQTGSFLLVSQTSSMSVATASFISDTFISASAVRSGFGAGGGSPTDISALNTFTASIQTEVTTLTAATSSYLTSADTGSFLTSVPSGTISGSSQITSVITDTYISASAALSGFGAGGAGGIFDNTTGTIYQSTGKTLQITGSDGTYALNVSQSVNAFNINAGNPTSNTWQNSLDGSYFNNFTKNTDVSEILRFVAGLLSSSAPQPNPNGKVYNSISENKSNTTTGTIAGYIPTNYSDATINYLVDKGFGSAGSTLFSGKTVYNNNTYGISYTSVASGTTSEQSAVDAQLFGLGILNSGNASVFNVSGSHDFTFSDNQAGTTTETSHSVNLLTKSSFGTVGGLTLGKINTANPSVIPAAYQDGKFAGVFNTSPLLATTRTLTSPSASGTYSIDTTIGIATGSQTTYVNKTVSETIFFAPLSNIESNIGTNSLSISNQSTTALTLTSGSISGAPFVDGGTWNLVATSSGIFEPMYVASTSAGRTVITSPTPSNVNVTRTSGVDTLSTAGGVISTTNAVYGTDGTLRSTSTVPFRTDNFHTDATYTISGTGTTFTEGGFADTDFTLAIRSRNRSNSETTLNTQTVSIHSAGTFGQPAASGSMGYHGGGSTNTTLIEYFTSESYRRTISDSSTLNTIWDDSANLTLGDGGDLQVKPGYLVNPESANGYWYPTAGYNAAHYKWYLREFNTGATNSKGTLTINLDPNTSADLTTFNDTTSNKIAVGVIFGSSAATIFDAVKGNASYGGTLNGQSTGNTNPFSDSVDVKGDFASITNTSGTLTLGINNSAGQTINGTHSKIWLLVRYTGTPSNTLERITISV